MNYILSIVLIFFTHMALADEIYPSNCTPLVVTDELLAIPAAKSMVTMIHNISNTDLWITHPVAEAGASWSSHLQSGHWSALILNDEKFELSCIESIPGHEQQVACSAVLAVCQWHAASLPKKPSDTKWAAEDMALAPLSAFIARQGFVLSVPAQ